MTDGVMDDIFWIHGTRKHWFNTRLGAEKIKNNIPLIYAFYILYVIYIVYILYIVYICRVKSEWYINRTSFTTYIVEAT